jgi:hypothetical protein
VAGIEFRMWPGERTAVWLTGPPLAAGRLRRDVVSLLAGHDHKLSGFTGERWRLVHEDGGCPFSSAERDCWDGKHAVLQRLRELCAVVPGWEDMDSHEVASHLPEREQEKTAGLLSRDSLKELGLAAALPWNMGDTAGQDLSDLPVACPLCHQIHQRCRFTAGTL